MQALRQDEKPYYSLDYYLKESFGEKIYKIALDGGFTCPNRDGTLDTRGCIFCSQGGSGDFAAASLSEGLTLFGDKKTGNRFIAYFQAYSNTYGPIETLRSLYSQALSLPEVAGISIATRPDCLPNDVILLLDELRQNFPDKLIWVELGLQTCHENSISYIRRGYKNAVFESAVSSLHAIQIPVIVHVILGLPGETLADMLETIDYVNRFSVFGIKLQLLHVLRGTDLAADYLEGKFQVMELNDYIITLIACLRRLSPHTVVHRLTGDGPKTQLIAPLWSCSKRTVLNTLHRTMKELNCHQGDLYQFPEDERSVQL